jgi:tight adherence protein C
VDFFIFALIFGSCFALAYGAYLLPSRSTLKDRLARLADGSSVPIDEHGSEGLLAEDGNSLLLTLLRPLAGRAAQSTGASVRSLRQRLIEAGYRREKHVLVFLGTRIVLALLLPLLMLFTSPMWDVSELQLAVLLCTAAGIGWVAPSYYLDKARKRRHDSMLRGLPDALDLMVVCVEAGLGINASLARVSREFARNNPVLSAEFELATLEIRAGKSSTDALRALAHRTGVSEVGSLVAMLVQTERFGTSLADALRVQADSMRVQRMQRAEEQAAKAPLKMLFPTLIIFIATLIVTLGPGMLQLFGFFAEKGS